MLLFGTVHVGLDTRVVRVTVVVVVVVEELVWIFVKVTVIVVTPVTDDIKVLVTVMELQAILVPRLINRAKQNLLG